MRFRVLDGRSGHVAPADAPTPACHAPYVSLYLDPRGIARACCENQMYELGNVVEESILGIWRGERLRTLRATLEQDDLSRGCEGCATAIRSGARHTARVGQYDDTTHTSSPDLPTRLELSLSNRCNLQCVMCNGELSSSIRTHREHRDPLPTVYGAAFFAELATLAPHLEHVSFLGGEPFLGSESVRAMETLADNGFTGRIHVTTNGTVLNDRVKRLLGRLDADVAISIDGHLPATVEAIRVGASHATLMDHVEWFRRTTRERGARLGFHYCLMRSNWQELHPFLAWADGLDADVSVLPVRRPLAMCLDRADDDELAHALTTMRGVTGALGRNAGVWADELARLESLLAARGAGAPVSLTTRRVADDLTTWSDGHSVHEVAIDGDGLIVGADDVMGMALRSLVGEHSTRLLPVFQARFGMLERSDVLASSPGVEDRLLVFSGGTTLRVQLVPPTDDGVATWRFGARAEASRVGA